MRSSLNASKGDVMKYLSVFAFSMMLTTIGFTQTPKTQNLKDQKTLSNNQIDAAISRLEESRPCVKNASNSEELKKCEQRLRSDLKAMSISTKETRKDIRKFHKKESI